MKGTLADRGTWQKGKKHRTDQKIFTVTGVQVEMNLWNRKANIGLKKWVRIMQINRCPAINRRRNGYLIKQTNKQKVDLAKRNICKVCFMVSEQQVLLCGSGLTLLWKYFAKARLWQHCSSCQVSCSKSGSISFPWAQAMFLVISKGIVVAAQTLELHLTIRHASWNGQDWEIAGPHVFLL